MNRERERETPQKKRTKNKGVCLSTATVCCIYRCSAVSSSPLNCSETGSEMMIFKIICVVAMFASTQCLVQMRTPKLSRHHLLMNTKAQLPLKIAVAGAGVGGVFLGYALQSKGFDVTVFEKSSKFSRFGGPIQLASNALSCVNALSPDLFEQIMGRFTFTGTRLCGIKDGIRNSWYSVFGAIKNLAEWYLHWQTLQPRCCYIISHPWQEYSSVYGSY